MNIQVSILVSVALISSVLFLRRRRTPRLPYPPGPMVTDIPIFNSWVQYQKWGEEYGPIIYIGNRNILIINDLQVAVDLLEKRASIYSDRESSVILRLSNVENTDWALQRYSDKWRKNRKTFLQTFRQAAVHRFYPTQYKEVYLFLQRLLTAPDEFMQHTMALSQRSIYTGLYGLDVEARDPLARKTLAMLEDLSLTQLPGAFPLLARFPWLRFFPSWFPGCDFKQFAQHLRKEVTETASIPFDLAVNNRKSGKSTAILADLAAENEQNPEQIERLKAMGTRLKQRCIPMAAGADTIIRLRPYQTGASVSSFLLAMVMHPDVQARGQEEIDRIVGPDRLPTFEDRLSLPFVESIYRCVVIPNIWAMNRDPSRYPDPNVFRPERFLELPNGPFTSINDISAFGFGRRICPGRYMADNTVWLAIASVLATLTLGKAKDEEGNEVKVSGEFTDAFLRFDFPFFIVSIHTDTAFVTVYYPKVIQNRTNAPSSLALSTRKS
ncbi:hypothetical protein D9757_006785 [Collybiopsis confluens]|uniref:Cytochrome P450 n=1 Tax=Collybiopsis confluens TaxID=2823264 RepID=A0A8H5M8V5_9AGAR|nr:hypothetical protein D9757_006785 [Collybiopsis confluens]